MEQLKEQRWDMIRNSGNIVLMDDDTDNNLQWILIVSGPCKGEVWQISEYGVQRLAHSDFLSWLGMYLNGGLDQCLAENKKLEYAHKEDFFERCKNILKKNKIYMNPTISLEAVKQFETEHNVEFPEEYIQLVTNIGDGSKKSPWFIKKIRRMDEFGSLNYMDKPFFIQTLVDFNRIFNNVNNRFGRSNPIWDVINNGAVLEKEYSECWLLPEFQSLCGCIPLIDRGNPSSNSSYVKQYILILNGMYRGQVWSIDNWNMVPTCNVLLDDILPINALTCLEARIIGII